MSEDTFALVVAGGLVVTIAGCAYAAYRAADREALKWWERREW